MQTLSPDNLLAALRWRYATKQFDPKAKIPAPVWDTLEQCLVLSASSYGLQPWKFIVVEKPEVRQALRSVSWNQPQVVDASHYVVMAAKQTISEADLDRLIAAMSAARGVTTESLGFYKEMMASDLLNGPRSAIIPQWTARQVYIALGALLTSAALLGVDACPMEGLDPAAYDQILGLQGSDYRTAVACALGYRASGDKYAALAKVRYPRSEIIQHVL